LCNTTASPFVFFYPLLFTLLLFYSCRERMREKRRLFVVVILMAPGGRTTSTSGRTRERLAGVKSRSEMRRKSGTTVKQQQQQQPALMSSSYPPTDSYAPVLRSPTANLLTVYNRVPRLVCLSKRTRVIIWKILKSRGRRFDPALVLNPPPPLFNNKNRKIPHWIILTRETDGWI
jgi:hypothetical protein